MNLPPCRIALAVGEPHEARLLALLEAAPDPIAGRGCVVSAFCSTVRGVREALGQPDSIDVVVMSSTLQAVSRATLDELVAIGRPLVVVARDASAPGWIDFAAPVINPECDAASLAAAIADALQGRRRASRAHAAAERSPARSSRTHRKTGVETTAKDAVRATSGEVITVTSAESPEGKTTVAVSLAYALSFAGPTALLDVNARGSAVEFHLPVDPARGLPQLGRRTREGGGWKSAFEDDQAWRAAIDAELQPMGADGHGQVACGVSTLAYREHLTDALLERVIATLRSSHRFIVLDGSGGGWGPADPPIDRAALHAADRLLVVLRPDEQGIERTRRVFDASVNQRHLERIGLVLNQVGLTGTDEVIGAIEYRLQAPVVAVLPFDAVHLAAARAQHRPAVCEPGCRLSTPLLDLAARLAGEDRSACRSALLRPGPAPWWRRLAMVPAAVFG